MNASWRLLIVLVISLFCTILCETGTRISGFGSRSPRKTIFPAIKPNQGNSTKALHKESKEVKIDIPFFRRRKTLTTSPKLWVQKDTDTNSLLLQTRDGSTPKTLVLTVNDLGDWEVREHKLSKTTDKQPWIPIEGIYGVYELPSGIVWVLITNTELTYDAPKLAGQNVGPWWQIRRVSDMELVHLSCPGKSLSTSNVGEEVRQLRLLRQSLKQHDFYFVPQDSEHVADMTCTMQTSLARTHQPGNKTRVSWWSSKDRQPDPRFFWNQAAIEPIILRHEEAFDPTQRNLTDTLLQHTTPVASAFVGVQSNTTTGGSFPVRYDQILISRRSRFRAGTRFTRRGADASGSVANFAETEQVCLIQDETAKVQQVLSYVQVRGSIPLRWSSPADVKTYNPRVRIGTDPLAHARSLRSHLLEQFRYYVTKKQGESSKSANLVFVNLIDKKKDQLRLGRAFDSVLQAILDVHADNSTDSRWSFKRASHSRMSPVQSSEQLLADKAVEHVWFDFHAQVKKGKWHRLTRLLKEVQGSLTEHGYFWADAPITDKNWQIQQNQKAVIRTNCMDCLDRTNVVQSIFARHVLFHQLSTLANKQETGKTKQSWADYQQQFRRDPLKLPWSVGEERHRSLWADNADAISRLYAGTRALKGDFTRTGQRTKRGALDDGMNSLQRYYLNNFLDADRQEGMDLMVGHSAFSNAQDESTESTNATTSHNGIPFLGQEAARQPFFGGVMERMNEHERDNMERRLNEIGVSGGHLRRDLDLRWIPGDLQSHVRSHADNRASKLARNLHTRAQRFDFTTTVALKEIDRRSSTILPWWAPMEDPVPSGLEGKENDESTSDPTAEPPDEVSVDDERLGPTSLVPSLVQQEGRTLIPPAQLLSLLVVAIKVPLVLPSSLVALLTLLCLPDILELDLGS